MNKIHLLLLVTTLCALASCASLTGSVKPEPEKPLPTWVLNPPSDDRQTYFGVGQGRDLAQAKQAALQEISSKISISVGGRSEAVSTLYNDLFQQSGYTQVRTETADKELQNYQVLQSSESKGQFYALISVAKQDLARSWEAKLNRLDQIIEAELDALSQYSILEQYVAWQQVNPNVRKASALTSLINTVRPGFDTAPYERRYLDYASRANKTLNRLNVYVESGSALTPIAKTFIKQLTKLGIKASGSKTREANTSIEIRGNERTFTIYDSYTVELRLMISIRNSNGSVVTTKPIEISGGSVIDYASARISASNNLEKKINKHGLFALLGLEKR